MGYEPFNSDTSLLLIKGAPDILLPSCSYAICPDGSRVEIDEELRSRIATLQEAWASRGQRVILLARKTLKDLGIGFDHALFGDEIVKAAKDLTFCGLVGIVVLSFLFANQRIHLGKIFQKLSVCVALREFVSSW